MKKYFLHLYGKSVGPYSFDELRTMNIAPTTPVWYDGLGNWKNANEVFELKSLFAPNPQAFYQQQPNYSTPTSRSTNFANTNLSGTETPKGNSKVAIIVVVIVVALAAIGGFLIYNVVEKKKRMAQEVDEMIEAMRIQDSIQNMIIIMNYDSTRIADSIAYESDPQSAGSSSDDLVGSFNNYSGGTIQVNGRNDQRLSIRIKYVSETGEYCTGEVSGTGSREGEGKVIMRTDDGCKITLTYTGLSFISVEESYNCKSLHGKACTFEGVYLKE